VFAESVITGLILCCVGAVITGILMCLLGKCLLVSNCVLWSSDFWFVIVCIYVVITSILLCVVGQ